MDKEELALEAWKRTVSVQEHFNTIQMQVRSIAVTVVTATVAAAAVLKGQSDVELLRAFGLRLGPASLVVAGGLVAWGAFWFVDRHWYHRLLRGAVRHGELIEKQSGDVVSPFISLTKAVTEESRFHYHKWLRPFLPKRIRDEKITAGLRLSWFYLVLAAVQLILMLCLSLDVGQAPVQRGENARAGYDAVGTTQTVPAVESATATASE